MSTSTVDDFYVATTQAEQDAIAAQLFSERIASTTRMVYDLESGPLSLLFEKKKKVRRVAKDKYFSTDVSNNDVKHERTMNTKLRLLVTGKCHNDCPLCCNKQFNFNELEVVDRWDYEEVMITGGEPLASNRTTSYLIDMIMGIRAIWDAQGWKGKIYLYTSTRRADLITKIIPYLDGIVYTPHNIKELNTFMQFAPSMSFRRKVTDQSLRLNLFKEVADAAVIKALGYGGHLIQKMWQIKPIEWIPNCPLPEGEDFKRIKFLL